MAFGALGFEGRGPWAVGGAGLVVVEATAVSPEGRISPADSGIYLDEHVEPFARIVRFLKQQGSVAGIQLAHAGRKASASKPWEGDKHIDEPEGGWPTIAPSAVAFGDRLTGAGFEWLELHFAHGYLAHEFYSPLANQRTDQYGGNYENLVGPIALQNSNAEETHFGRVGFLKGSCELTGAAYGAIIERRRQFQSNKSHDALPRSTESS